MIKGWLDNDKLTIAKLEELPERSDKRLMNAIRQEARKVKAAMRANLGSALKVRSWVLRKSLFMRTKRNFDASIKSYVGTAPRRGGWYGHFHEYGFKHRSGGQVKARPYAAPALASRASEIRQAMRDAILGAAQEWDK